LDSFRVQQSTEEFLAKVGSHALSGVVLESASTSDGCPHKWNFRARGCRQLSLISSPPLFAFLSRREHKLFFDNHWRVGVAHFLS
jgi:hypothetical protein